MLVQNRVQIEELFLFPNHLRLEIEGKSTPFMRWRDLPELRQAIGDEVATVIAIGLEAYGGQ